jgi:hypothetical protein
MAKSIRCILGWHRYVQVHSPESIDPDPYFLRCRRCGHERDKPMIQF